MQDERPAFDVTNSVRQVTGQFMGAVARRRSATWKRTSGLAVDWCGYAAVTCSLVWRRNEVRAERVVNPFSRRALHPLGPRAAILTLDRSGHLMDHRFVPFRGDARAEGVNRFGGAYRAKRPGGV